MSALQQVTIRVYGVVQGVCFRAETRRQALRLGLTGLVRNEPDGSVYVEAQGPAAALAEFVDWCRRGPPSAEVERIETGSGNLRSMAGFVIDF